MKASFTKRFLFCALVAFFPLGRAADKSGTLPEGVEVKTYFGWPNCLVLEAADPEVRAIGAPGVGGRVVHYSLQGEDILFESPRSQGKTLFNTKDGLWVGGYQCYLGPELRGIADHPGLWVGPY